MIVCETLSTSLPIVRVQRRGVDSVSLVEGAAPGPVITPTEQGAQLIVSAFDIFDRSIVYDATMYAEVLSVPATIDITEWDAVEEVDLVVAEELEICDVAGQRLSVLSDEIAELRGLVRLQVLARGRSGPNPEVRVQL